MTSVDRFATAASRSAPGRELRRIALTKLRVRFSSSGSSAAALLGRLPGVGESDAVVVPEVVVLVTLRARSNPTTRRSDLENASASINV